MSLREITDLLEEMDRIPGFDPGPVRLASIETLRAAYNGCGPERWPQAIRDLLDSRTSDYAPAVLVHDLEFHQSDGTARRLAAANDRFRRNLEATFHHRYPLLTWKILRPSYRLARARAKAVMMALALAISSVFTRRAWLEAYEARTGMATASFTDEAPEDIC
jgi:hypothetical protein